MPFAYLDIDNPLCAWSTYRGTLVLPPNDGPFLSVWMTGLLKGGDDARLQRELQLEDVRAKMFPRCVSRLRCIFCFETNELAQRALAWDQDGRTHFQTDYLAEIAVEVAQTHSQRLDSNWIGHSNKSGDLPPDWMERYWQGEPFPRAEPHWETLLSGSVIVLGTELRLRAYEAVKLQFPKSMLLLELARQAAWIGSNLGSISAVLRKDGEELRLDFAMNMEDARDQDFLDRLTALRESGHPINWADIRDPWQAGTFGHLPDLRPYGLSWRVTQSQL